MRASVAVLALAATVAPVLGAPNVLPRQQFNLYNDGTKGTVTGQADDFSASYHASGYLSRLGCSTTAQITQCYTAVLAADTTKELETKDAPPYIVGGVGTNQRSLLLSEPWHKGTPTVVTHKVRIHISTTYTAVPVGQHAAVTFVGLRNFDFFGTKALDVRARTFTGEETSGTVLYVAVVNQDGTEDFPTGYSLSDVVGKTIEITYTLGVSGLTIDPQGVFVADVTAKVVATGQQLFSVSVTKTAYPKGVLDTTPHRLIFGADRNVTVGQQELKVWFGDYSVSPLPDENPDKRAL